MTRREVKRLSVGQPQTRTHSGRRFLERCKENSETENMVFIDVDSGKVHCVITDVPETSQNGLQGSKVLSKHEKLLSSSVISIDDDNVSDDDNPESGEKVGGDQGSGAIPSKAYAEESDSDECQFIQEGEFPLKLSKCKRTYSGKARPRNCFGLSPICENSSSESDSSDCEIMEGSSQTIREQWERAAFRKRMHEDDDQNGKSGLEDHASASGSSTETPKNIGENMAQQHDEEPIFPASRNANDEIENLSICSRNESHFKQYNVSFQGEEGSMCTTEKSYATQFNKDKVVPCYKDEGIHQEPSFGNIQSLNATKQRRGNFKCKENPVSGEPLCNGQLCSEKLFNNGMTCSVDKDEMVLHETEFIYERPSCQDKENNVEKGEPHVNYKRACFKDEEDPTLESVCDIKPQDEMSPVLHARDGDDICDVQNDIIGEREKFKETDEYKRAEAEEWASRQQQLQIQAEEVQRLRKRKRAETRLIDMERRQKQRLEEIRETQKKDMEIMNLKEQLRVEAKKELDEMEVKYTDMASLLRGLGIHVEGGLYPMSHEVHAAYKQALLKFHPDRALRTDIRQQVEAEEKFKLISRLKEKLLLTL